MGKVITFCATSKTGLGHLRRATKIAAALGQRQPDYRIELVTNAPLRGLAPEESALFDPVRLSPRGEMARLLTESPADCIVVDTAVIPGLSSLHQPLCLILRETPGNRVCQFALPQSRPWDLVIVPNPQEHWLPPATEITARQIVPVGWIYRATLGPDKDPATGGDRLRSRENHRLVLIASGGGGSKETASLFSQEVASVIEILRQDGALSLEFVQCLGPRADHQSIVPGVDRIIDPGSRLNEMFQPADLVVSTAGYNSVLELACTDVPTLLVPIGRRIDDQPARARKWAPLLGLDHHWGNASRSASWISSRLAAGGRRPAVDLGVSGEARAACLIAKLAS